MGRVYWKPANLLNPVPVVLVTCADAQGKPNVMTAAWVGTACSDPVMITVAIRKRRYSHDLIVKSGEFGINLVSEELVKATDYAGIYSGAKVDKFALPDEYHLTAEKALVIKAPVIRESPLCLECRLVKIEELGSHDLFIGEVVSSDIDEKLLDENGRLDLSRAHLVVYCHGEYYGLGKKLGRFGFSSFKPERKNRKNTGVHKSVPVKSRHTADHKTGIMKRQGRKYRAS